MEGHRKWPVNSSTFELGQRWDTWDTLHTDTVKKRLPPSVWAHMCAGNTPQRNFLAHMPWSMCFFHCQRSVIRPTGCITPLARPLQRVYGRIALLPQHQCSRRIVRQRLAYGSGEQAPIRPSTDSWSRGRVPARVLVRVLRKWPRQTPWVLVSASTGARVSFRATGWRKVTRHFAPRLAENDTQTPDLTRGDASGVAPAQPWM